MTFIVTLIALLLERFFDWSHLRRWNWFMPYQRVIVQRLPQKAPNFVLAAIILPLLIVVGIIQYLLYGVAFGLIELLFQLCVFIYCLGQQNLWADTFASVNALVHGDTQSGMERIKASFGMPNTTSEQSLHQQLLKHIFIEANRRIFAVVFWFVLLGPLGALLYRTVTLVASESAQPEASAELIQSARSIQSVLDWIPVRLFTFFFALGGHFVNVFSCWRKKAVLKLDINDKLLTECGFAALGEGEDHIAQDGSAEKNAIGLLDRAFVITLVVIAVMVLIL